MSKLSASHLFDAMQSFQGPHTKAVQRKVPALSVERLASFLEAGSSAKDSQVTAVELAQSIRHAFDLDQDRIVADPNNLLDLPTVPIGRRLRFDVPHERESGGAALSSPPAKLAPHAGGEEETQYSVADSLSAALGVAQARDVLLHAHWIVVVADASSPLSAECQELLGLLAREQRVLIIWCETNSPSRMPQTLQNRRLLEEMLPACGLGHLGPLGDMTCDDLISILQALKVLGQASLVHLRLRDDGGLPEAPHSRAAVEDGTGDEPPAGEEPRRVENQPSAHLAPPLEAIEASLVNIASRDPRAVVVDRRPEVARTNLGARLGKRFVAPPQEDPYLWQWCAGLVSGGCRPILLIHQRQWLQTAVALAALPDGVELPATVVVLTGSPAIWPSCPEPAEFLPDATLVVAGDLRDFETALATSLGHGGVTVLCAPVAARPREAGVHLRFDPAESAWIDRQSHAGETEREQILAKRFSPELAPWIAAYERAGQRGGYIWKWCLHGVELTTLSCVPPSWRAHVCDTKVLAGMLNVLIDDAADRPGREALLAELFRLTYDEPPRLRRFPAAERRYGEFTCEVWSAFWSRAKQYPCYDRYVPLLQFDLAQLFNTVRYSHLVNSNPYILNVVEHDDYSPQGMGLLGFAMLDLMCSPDFSMTDLGRLREAMWHAQWMARIGNLVTTWQREVRDRDYTSGVFAHAVANHDLTVEQLLTDDPAHIATAIERGGHEAYYIHRWKQHRAHMAFLLPQVRSVDLAAMLRGLERLLQTELVSRGEK
ncbi:MAG TPA: hypothetical protein VG826_11295 [Pirellulales bacterium]|nr:hypothetical protein [Pirellulales bacterium]